MYGTLGVWPSQRSYSSSGGGSVALGLSTLRAFSWCGSLQGRLMRKVLSLPRWPLRTTSQAKRARGPERSWLPHCTTRLCSLAALTRARPSPIELVSGFSQ